MNIEEHTNAILQILSQDIWSGKTSREHSAVTPAVTSRQSSQRSSKSSKQTLPIFLYLTRENGASQDASWATETQVSLFPSHGDYMTHSFGESPSAAVESRLSQILEESAHPKYYLSAKACQGILNRAAKRGKELPELLKTALMSQAGVHSNS